MNLMIRPTSSHNFFLCVCVCVCVRERERESIMVTVLQADRCTIREICTKGLTSHQWTTVSIHTFITNMYSTMIGITSLNWLNLISMLHSLSSCGDIMTSAKSHTIQTWISEESPGHLRCDHPYGQMHHRIKPSCERSQNHIQHWIGLVFMAWVTHSIS